ncbi:MAG: hypothetical protein RIG66_19775 [Coleofasciculus sp. E2-BRE-01]
MPLSEVNPNKTCEGERAIAKWSRQEVIHTELISIFHEDALMSCRLSDIGQLLSPRILYLSAVG